MNNRAEKKITEYLVFYDLSDENKRFIADNSNIRYYINGEYLFKQGEPANCFYLLTRGDIELLEVSNSRMCNLPVHCVREGELLGWSWLVPPFRWNYDCRAVGDVEVIEVDASHIKQKMEEDHEFAYQIHKRFIYTLVDRLKHTRLALLNA